VQALIDARRPKFAFNIAGYGADRNDFYVDFRSAAGKKPASERVSKRDIEFAGLDALDAFYNQNGEFGRRQVQLYGINLNRGYSARIIGSNRSEIGILHSAFAYFFMNIIVDAVNQQHFGFAPGVRVRRSVKAVYKKISRYSEQNKKYNQKKEKLFPHTTTSVALYEDKSFFHSYPLYEYFPGNISLTGRENFLRLPIYFLSKRLLSFFLFSSSILSVVSLSKA